MKSFSKNRYAFIPLVSIAFSLFLYLFYSSFSENQGNNPANKAIEKNPDVTIIGPVKMADGIGRQTAELAMILKEDFKVRIISDFVDPSDVHESVLKRVNQGRYGLGRIVLMEESLWEPGKQFDRYFHTVTNDDQLRFAYSMLESTKIPPEWAMQLNLYFDAVAVPDAFLVEAYRSSGVTIPIFELPLGLDLQDFLEKPLKKERNKRMVFANLSTCLDRKNHLLLVRAFAKALGNNENAELRINARHSDREAREALIEEIVRLNCSNIYFSEVVLSKEAYLKFFQSVDCYISLSKAEGFSIQPREAMALGIPVIVSDNTGQSTICSSNLTRVVKSEIVEPAYYFNRKINNGYRFNCELDDAVDAIQDMYLNYDQYLTLASQARKWASQYCYSNEGVKDKYKNLMAPKNLILGTENKITEDYLMTDSKELFEKFQRLRVEKKKKQSKTKV